LIRHFHLTYLDAVLRVRARHPFIHFAQHPLKRIHPDRLDAWEETQASSS
jgi:hypothetical protein